MSGEAFRQIGTVGGALLGCLALMEAPSAWASPSQARGEKSFEALVRAADSAPDADALVAPFAENCENARREIDRARCRGSQAFLRNRLPGKNLHAVVDSTRVVSVSGYDASLRGHKVRLLGCLTCDDPAKGPQGETLYVTLASPRKGGASLREEVVLGQTAMRFEDPAKAREFESTVKPHLRAEFVFRGDGTPWSFGKQRGVAFTPIAMRIFNRCTGDVLYSQPASEGPVTVVKGLSGCEAPEAVASDTGKTEAKTEAKTSGALAQASNTSDADDSQPGQGKQGKEGTEVAPEKLGAREIVDALKPSRDAVAACDAQWNQPGAIELEFDLSGSGGAPQSVRAKGKLGGTSVANCVLNAVRATKFPKFVQARQTFSYSVRLGAVQR